MLCGSGLISYIILVITIKLIRDIQFITNIIELVIIIVHQYVICMENQLLEEYF